MSQEIFDTVVRHLAAQGRQALGPSGACRYRAPNGDKCAIGCLIADDEYRPEIEGRGVDEPPVWGSLPARLREVSVGFLSALQDVHDVCSVSYWPDALRDLAKRRGLDPSVVDESFTKEAL